MRIGINTIGEYNMNPIDNKYTKHYWKLVDTRKNRIIDGYTEKHHIIPRSLGGTNLKNNLVSLTPREHFIAHLLLSKMFDGNEKYKMYYAFNMILVKSKDNQRYKPTSRFYERARHLVGETATKLNKGTVPWNKGLPRTQAVKDAVSKANKNKQAWNKNIQRTTEDREKMKAGWAQKTSASIFVPHNKGRKEKKYQCTHCNNLISGMGAFVQWHGDNCKNNPINAGKQATITHFTKNNPSNIKKQCEHCGKECSLPNYKRWHSNNCKLKRLK